MNNQSTFKLSKNSLVYKFLDAFYTFPPVQNLCSLIRGLFIASLFSIVFGLVILGLIYILLSPFIYFINIMWLNPVYALRIESIAVGVGIFDIFLLLCVLCAYSEPFEKFVRNYIFLENLRSNRESKQPNVVFQYVKDKHNKICRSIELTDE